MKNNLSFLFLLFLLFFSIHTFSMVKQFSKMIGAGKRLICYGIHDHVNDIMDEYEPKTLGQLEIFEQIVEVPISALKSSHLKNSVEYTWSEFKPMLCGFDPEYGFLMKAHCPFCPSLLNDSNAVNNQDVFDVLNFCIEEKYEIIGKKGFFVIRVNTYNCELNVPFSLLYYATMLNKNIVLIKKLVEECGEDVSFNVFEHMEDNCHIPYIESIVLCPTPLSWAILHKNKAVIEYLSAKIVELEVNTEKEIVI